MIRTAALAALTVLAPIAPAFAQQPSATVVTPPATVGEIHGRIVNAVGHTPIGRGEVEVTLAGSSAPAARVSTSADGSFRIPKLRAGRYRIRIRALGYTPKELLPVDIGAASPSVDVGTIGLVTAPLKLQAMAITGQVRDVQLAPDRNTFVVRDMPTTRGGTAIDVLRNVPAVDVDIDNIVSLRGNSGVVVQVNGRKSPMKPAQLGNFLAQLPADMVDKVEVIPNPSARDDPEGQAGIINIVLKTQVDGGTSGGLTTTGGTSGRAEVAGNLGYEHGPLTAYGSYGFMRDNRPRSSSIFRENLYTSPVTYLEEHGRRTQVPLAHTLTGSAGYKLSEHDQLSADVMYSTRVETGTNNILYRDLNASRDLTGVTSRLSDRTNHEFNLESTLAYKHAFDGERHQLSGELRIDRAREGGPADYSTQTLALGASPAGTPALETQTGWEHPGESSIKMDYSRPLASHVRMETGYKGSIQRFHTTLDTRVFDTTRSAYFADTTRTSDFTYRQLVNAAYAMLDAELGKFVLQGGARVEHASTRFDLTTRSTTYDNAYNSIFPTALVAYNIDESRQLKLSYSTRIRRPDDTDLIDPTLHVQDPLNVSRGNPYLKPEYTRALELGLQQTANRMTVQVTPFFRHTLDAVRRLRTLDTTGVATTTFANIATTDSYGTDATVALGGGTLSGFAGASAFRQVSNAANLAPGLAARTFGWTARTNTSWRVSKTFDVQSLLFYRGAMTVEQGRDASRLRFSLAARQKLMDDRASVTLRVIDPFNTGRERFTTIDPAFYQVSDQMRHDRGLVLSANWTFGKPPKHRSPDGLDASGDVGP